MSQRPPQVVQQMPVPMHQGAWFNEPSLLTHQSHFSNNVADFIEHSRFCYAQVQPEPSYNPPAQANPNSNDEEYFTDEEYEESTRLNTTTRQLETIKVPTAKQTKRDIEESFLAAKDFVDQKERSKNSTQQQSNSIA